MTIRSFLIFIVSALLYTAGFGQAPGFMGKRLVVGYGFHFSPAIFGSNGQHQSIIGDGGSAETEVIAFNSLHEGYLEYATSPRFMVGLSCKYYKTTYDNGMSIDNYSRSYASVYGRPTSYYDINGISVALYGKLYGKRYVAPWGRYIIFGPVLNIRSTKYDPNEMHISAYDLYSSNTNLTVNNFGPKKETFYGLNVLFGWGRNRMIGSRITIDYGASVHVISLFSALFDTVDPDFGFNQVDETNYIQRTSGKRVRGVNRFNAFIKIGFLL